MSRLVPSGPTALGVSSIRLPLTMSQASLTTTQRVPKTAMVVSRRRHDQR